MASSRVLLRTTTTITTYCTPLANYYLPPGTYLARVVVAKVIKLLTVASLVADTVGKPGDATTGRLVQHVVQALLILVSTWLGLL